MPLAVSDSDIAQLIADNPFLHTYGLRLHALGDGECTLLIPYNAAFDRPDGLVSGPMYMAAADACLWFAIMTRLGVGDGAPTVTVEMKTAFLRGATRADILCHARILKWGRRLIYGVAECTTRQGELLTHHTLTYIRPDLKK